MAENTWEVPVGTNAVFYPLLYLDNKPITTYSGGEPVRARVWQGDDTADAGSVVTVTFDAAQAAVGQTTAVVNGSATAAMVPGLYRVRCEIQLGGNWFSYFEGFLLLTDSPGAAATPPVYCTLQEMLDVGGDFLQKLMVDSGRMNFLAERAAARQMIDRVILSRIRPAVGDGSNWLISYGYSSPLYGGELPDPYVKSLLDTNKLLVTDDIVRASAYYAIYLACEKANTWEAGDPFLARAVWAKHRFNQTIFATTAQFDTNGDGAADYAVNLGRFSLR